MATFGERLKSLRKERGIRQVDLAEIMGVTKGTVAKWEQDVRRPDFDTMNTLCNEFDVTLGWIMGEDVERTPTEPSNDFLAEGMMENEAETITYMVKRLVRLNQQSRSIVQATLNAVYRLDKARKLLESDGQFNVSITLNPDFVYSEEDEDEPDFTASQALE